VVATAEIGISQCKIYVVASVAQWLANEWFGFDSHRQLCTTVAKSSKNTVSLISSLRALFAIENACIKFKNALLN